MNIGIKTETEIKKEKIGQVGENKERVGGEEEGVIKLRSAGGRACIDEASRYSGRLLPFCPSFPRPLLASLSFLPNPLPVSPDV